MKSKMNIHVNQMADKDNTLRVDNIEIKGRISGKLFVAESAVEYTIEEADEGTVEGEKVVDIVSALKEWVYPINNVTLVDNKIPVYCFDKILRPLVWVDEHGNGHAFVSA